MPDRAAPAHSDGRLSLDGFAPKRREKARRTTEAREQTKGDCDRRMAHYRGNRREGVQRDHDPREDRAEKNDLEYPVVLVLQHQGYADRAPARTPDPPSQDPGALGVRRTGASTRPDPIWSLRITISSSIPHRRWRGRTDKKRR